MAIMTEILRHGYLIQAAIMNISLQDIGKSACTGHECGLLINYRSASYSYISSLRSVFSLHNETGKYSQFTCALQFSNRLIPCLVNIWSHLFGMAYFLVGIVRFNQRHSQNSESAQSTPTYSCDRGIVSLYCASVAVCFALSAIFHTLSDQSYALHIFSNKLDHLGIVVVMWGTGVSNMYFALRCESPYVKSLYVVTLTLAATLCAMVTLRSRFRLPKYRTDRLYLYSFLGAVLFLPPMWHAWNSLGALHALNKAMGLQSFIGLASINSLGGVLYATRVPERWFPGALDLAGHSHNWMHVLTVVGAMIRLQGLLYVYEDSFRIKVCN